MERLAQFIYAVLAGICIGIGGVAFLSVENSVAGALFFTVGLFAICTFGFSLFTGKVSYLFDNKPSYLIFLGIVWLGNLAGAAAVGYAVRLTRISGISERAAAICEKKLEDNLLSIFILAVFCNILIYIAVDGFKNNPHAVGKYIGLFLGVAVFILCGFEHCVANMFYFSAANLWSLKTFGYLIIMTLGNAAGGLMIPACQKILKKLEKN